jgi:hypothetical protein
MPFVHTQALAGTGEMEGEANDADHQCRFVRRAVYQVLGIEQNV